MNDNYRQITVAQMSPHVHSFLANENKTQKIYEWLKQWIGTSLKIKKIKPFDLLPSKSELAYHIGVSTGTMQNVFRLLEDTGYVESKQRIGTYIKTHENDKKVNKLTSKREFAIESIKIYLLQNDYKKGEIIPSSRRLKEYINISDATIRIALNNLVTTGILKKKKQDFVIISTDYNIQKLKPQTLVEKTAQKLKKYIATQYKKGEKIPANYELAKTFEVSIKTVHDAIKLLSKNGYLYTKRGRYGTLVSTQEKIDLYTYERIKLSLKKHIIDNCNMGDKLPSMKILGETYQTSTKTIKKSLDELASEGYITYMRGRNGGTFVTDIPETATEAYQWLALDSNYLNKINN